MTLPPIDGKFPAALQILLVDDEPLIRWSLRRALSQRGHCVTEAGDAAEALRQIEADPGRFGVALLDYCLPDVQNLGLLREVRQLAPACAVLMMTAYGDAQMRADALALGARVVIDKPFQVNAVVSLLESPPPMRPLPHA